MGDGCRFLSPFIFPGFLWCIQASKFQNSWKSPNETTRKRSNRIGGSPGALWRMDPWNVPEQPMPRSWQWSRVASQANGGAVVVVFFCKKKTKQKKILEEKSRGKTQTSTNTYHALVVFFEYILPNITIYYISHILLSCWSLILSHLGLLKTRSPHVQRSRSPTKSLVRRRLQSISPRSQKPTYPIPRVVGKMSFLFLFFGDRSLANL